MLHMRRKRYAVIPTRNRPDDFRDCMAAITPQVDRVIIISHGASYADPLSLDWPDHSIIGYAEDPPNISRMWNLGLNACSNLDNPIGYDVAVLNDDVIVPPDWFERVVRSMREEDNASAGCVRRPRDLRMTGYAFILDGNVGLRADEQFQWWYGDDDLQRQAMQLGGIAYAGGQDVEHRHPNSTTVGVLAEIAGQDRERFIAKWESAR